MLTVQLGVVFQGITTVVAGAIIGLAYAPSVAGIGLACAPLTLTGGIIRLKVRGTTELLWLT